MSSLRARLSTAALAVCAAATAIAGTIVGLDVPAVATSAAAPAARPATPAEVDTAQRSGFVPAIALPRGKRFGSWSSGPVHNGVPRSPSFCLAGALPADQTSYAVHRGKKNVRVRQFQVQMGSVTDAAALVAGLRTQLQGCYRHWLDLDIPEYRNGQRSASWKRYPSNPAASGLTVYGVFTVPPPGFAKATHLYAVGRDGATVQVVHLDMPGSQRRAPVEAVAKVGAQALRQLG